MAARDVADAGFAEHLSQRGENLPLVAQNMYERHGKTFDKVLRKMTERVPGIADVKADLTSDGRVVLKFRDGQFKDPFISRFVSDGTIKMFAYLLLLYDPDPRPLLAIEEPENQLYPELLMELAEEFREYADRGGQVFISTHSPDFLNAVQLDELFWLKKEGGFSTCIPVAKVPPVPALVKEGDLLGALWKQRLFGDLKA